MDFISKVPGCHLKCGLLQHMNGPGQPFRNEIRDSQSGSQCYNANDHNLPLMDWYAAEPLVPLDMDRALGLALKTEIPNILPFTIRRMTATGGTEALRVLARALETETDPAKQAELVKGLNLLIPTDEPVGSE